MLPISHKPRAPNRLWAHGLLLLITLLWALPGSAARSVLVVSDKTNATHQTIVDSLRKALDGPGKDGVWVRIEPLDIRQVRHGIPGGLAPELIVTIGAKAAAGVNGHANGVPVLNVFLPRAAYLQILDTGGRPAAAVVLDQPLRRQLAVARALLPRAHTAGVLRGPEAQGDDVGVTQDDSDFGLALNITPIDPDQDPAGAIERLLDGSDVVIATFDPQVYTPATAKWLLYLAFQQQRPIVGFSYALLKAGAVAAVFSTPEQIAEHAADLIGEWRRTGLPPSGTAPPRYYHIGLNAPVAKRLGITPPPEADLRREVDALLGEEKP